MSSTNSWKIAQESRALFCLHCGGILDLPDTNDLVKCFDCPYSTTVSSAPQIDQIQTKVFEEKHQGAVTVNPTMRRATVQEPCPKCEFPQLRFYTMQMRSVDEGQTVFYECEKCGHTYSTNT